MNQGLSSYLVDKESWNKNRIAICFLRKFEMSSSYKHKTNNKVAEKSFVSFAMSYILNNFGICSNMKEVLLEQEGEGKFILVFIDRITEIECHYSIE